MTSVQNLTNTRFIDQKNIRQSLTLAWPIALQHILTNLLSMIDVAMVSHLGDAAVGAVGLGNRFTFMLTVIILGIAWTVGVLAAQYQGAGQTSRIRYSIAMGSVLAISALIPICLGNISLADNIIALGSTNPAIISQGQAYLWWVIPSLLFVAIIMCFENAIRSLGQVRLPMVLSTTAIIINIGLNYWLINGGLGVPALGVTGAAIATLLSRMIHLIILLGILHHLKHPLSFHQGDINASIDKDNIRHFLKLTLPMMISFGVWSAGTFAYQIIFGRMGTQELAVMSMLMPIEGIFLSFFFGLASACSIQVGQALGANQFDRAWLHARSFAILTPLISFTIGLIALALRDLIFLPFSGLPEATVQSANTIFILITLLSWLKVINITLSMGILRAGGDTKVVMYIDIIGMWVVSMPLALIAAFALQWPLFLVVAVIYIEDVCKASLFFLRMYQKHWLRNLTAR